VAVLAATSTLRGTTRREDRANEARGRANEPGEDVR
jgi:hypothetical protein